jgi:hypothetical protein
MLCILVADARKVVKEGIALVVRVIEIDLIGILW